MIRRASLSYKIIKHTIEVFVSLSIIIAVCAVGISWRLSQGPIALTPFKSQIEKTLRDLVPTYDVDFDDVMIKWQGHDHPLDITVSDMSLKNREGDEFHLHVPTSLVRLHLGDLLLGKFSAKAIRLIEPHAIIQNSEKYTLPSQINFNDLDKIFQERLIDIRALLHKLVYQDQLVSLEVIDGSLTYQNESLENIWSVDQVQAFFSGSSQELLVAAFQAQNHKKISDGVTISGPQHPIQLSISLDQTAKSNVYLKITHNALETDAIAKYYPFLDFFSHYRGSATLAASMNFSLVEVDSVMTLSASLDGGVFQLPKLFNKPVKNQHGKINVVIGKTLSDVKVAKASLKLQDCLLDVETQVRASDRGLDIPLQLKVSNLKTEEVSKYIPKKYSSRPAKWIRQNISHGFIRQADIRVPVKLSSNMRLLLAGDIRINGDFKGVSLASISGLPVIDNLSGSVTLDDNNIDVIVKYGEAMETLRLSSGRVFLSPLSSIKDIHAKINLSASGALADVDAVLKADPINYESMTDMRVEDISGNANFDLTVSFPLLSNLKLQQIDYNGQGAASDASFVLKHKKKGDIAVLKKGIYDVNFTSQKIAAKGAAVYKDNTVDLEVEYLSNPQAPYQSRVSVKSALNDSQLPNHLKKVVSIKTAVPYEFIYTSHLSGIDHITVHSRCMSDQVKLPLFGSLKNQNKLELFAQLKSVNGDIRELETFKLLGAGVDIQATGLLGLGSKKYQIEVLDVPVFKIGRNNLKAVMRQVGNDEWDVDLAGAQIDFTHLFEHKAVDGNAWEDTTENSHAAYDITCNLGKVFFGKNNNFNKTVGSIIYKNKAITMGKLDIMLEGGGSASVSLTPYDKMQKLHLTTSSLGELLQSVGIYEHATGGYASIEAERRIDAYGRPDSEGFKGALTGNNVRVVNAPALAKILSLTSFIGMVDTLRGKGILFDGVKGSFRLHNGALNFSDAVLKGAGFGIVFKGDMDCYKCEHKLNGSVIPMYAFNTMLSKVPVVGKIISGTKNESGLFAVSFVAEGDKQDSLVKVNPLTAFTPGIIQDVMTN